MHRGASCLVNSSLQTTKPPNCYQDTLEDRAEGRNYRLTGKSTVSQVQHRSKAKSPKCILYHRVSSVNAELRAEMG